MTEHSAAEQFHRVDDVADVMSAAQLSVSAFHRFYDPIQKYEELNPLALVEVVVDTRLPVFMSALADIEPLVLTPDEVPLAEAKVFGLEQVSSVGQFELPIPAKRQAEIIANIDARINYHVSRLVGKLDALIPPDMVNDGYGGLKDARLIERAELAAKMVAALSHHGQKRLSRRDYYYHPAEEMAMVRHAAESVLTPEQQEAYLPILLLESGDHDISESNIDPTKDADDNKVLDRPRGKHLELQTGVFGPRMIDMLASRLGIQTPEHSVGAGKSLQLITRTTGIYRTESGLLVAERMDYALQSQQGLEIGGIDFAVPKKADLQHNHKLEPLGAPNTKKNRDYKASEEHIDIAAQHLLQETGLDVPGVVRHIGKTTLVNLAEIMAYQSKVSIPFNHRRFARQYWADVEADSKAA